MVWISRLNCAIFRLTLTGITITELDTRLEKWIAFHNPTLMGATIHALGLPRDLNRCRTHVLKMKVRPRYDHGGSPGKYFRVEEAEPIEVSKAMSFPAPWPEALTDLVTLRVEQEQSGRGTVAVNISHLYRSITDNIPWISRPLVFSVHHFPCK